jgi:GT2 family glycosyltransferase
MQMKTDTQEHSSTKITPSPWRSIAPFGVVAIGRNEGDRLVRCLRSLSNASKVVYVDSGSSDNSVREAKSLGADVVELDPAMPFTAARARNAGFERLRQLAPELQYVQFIDGDCEMATGWSDASVSFLEVTSDVAAVCGILREREPEKSVYNWLCQQEWNGSVGEISACAGNVMHRAAALVAVGGYRENVVAAEEDELCLRLRAKRWKIWRLNNEMASHDAAMTHFAQWWRRSMRTGYAFAQGAALHGASPERHFVRQFRRAFIWGVLIPLACLAGILAWGPTALVLLAIYPLQVLRLVTVGAGPLRDRARLALFHVLARFPEGLGVLRFTRDRVFERTPTVIEHKRS